MHIMSRIPMVLVLLCLLRAPAPAQDHLGQTEAAPRYFTLDAFDPGAQKSRASSGALPQGQSSPGILPRAATVQPAPLSAEEKWKNYLRTTYGPTSFAYTAFGAGIKQARGSVPEWGGGMEGYGKRYASSFGQKMINRTVRTGMHVLLHEEPRYIPSGHSDLWTRTLYAATRAIIVDKDNGGTRIAYSRFAGHFTGAIVSRQWYPDRYQNTGEYLQSGFTSIGIDAAKNVFNEFWPDIKRMIRR